LGKAYTYLRMPKFRKMYYKAMETSKAAAAKTVFKPTKKASVRRAQDEEKHEKELYHPHWLHDLAFFEWLLDQPSDSGFDAVWDKFKRDWEGFTGDNFPATTHRQGPMVNQFKAIRRGKKRMFMKTTVKEGRVRLAEKAVLAPHVKVIDYLRAKKGLPPRPEASRAPPTTTSAAPSVTSSPPSPLPETAAGDASTTPVEGQEAADEEEEEQVAVSLPPPRKKKRKIQSTSIMPLPYQSRGNIFAELGM